MRNGLAYLLVTARPKNMFKIDICWAAAGFNKKTLSNFKFSIISFWNHFELIRLGYLEFLSGATTLSLIALRITTIGLKYKAFQGQK